ncbi:MAG: hypothetical protein IAF58_10390 [Leptolyngbya sp.]|nr:hypothetical protein [Candidatus Melainabacteria bacterium]
MKAIPLTEQGSILKGAPLLLSGGNQPNFPYFGPLPPNFQNATVETDTSKLLLETFWNSKEFDQYVFRNDEQGVSRKEQDFCSRNVSCARFIFNRTGASAERGTNIEKSNTHPT